MPSRKRARNAAASRRGPSPWQPLLQGLGRGLRRATPLWVGLLLIGVGTASAQHYIETSSAFTVQRIHEPGLPGWRRTAALEGLPLLHVNVAAVASELSQANPQMKFIRVTRRWPADVIVEAIPRRAVAQLRLRDFFPLDEDGFVFAAGTPAPTAALPIVEGAEQMGQRVAPGTITTAPRVHLALRLLDLLRAAPSLRQETVTLLDVANATQIIFRLQRGIEVRVGSADAVPKALERLGSVLAKLKEDQLTPQYIDLRFADPVIGPR